MSTKEVQGTHGKYLCSSDGSIFGVSGKKLKERTDKRGYLRAVIYYDNGISKSKLVHRLIASSFMPTNNEDSLEVNHIDGNKKNNNITNLEWCTHSYNITHAHKTGLITPMTEHNKHKVSQGSKKRATFSIDEASEICEAYSTGMFTAKEIAVGLNSSMSVVYRVINNTQKHYREVV